MTETMQRTHGGAGALITEEKLGLRVRQARLGAELTQADLAAVLDVDQATVSRIEAGKDISSITLARIAHATGRDIDYFLRPDPAGDLAVLWRRGDADEPGVRRAIESIERFAQDHAFITRLAQ